MGRTHSNAFGKVNQFFEVEYQPVLTAVCARNRASAQAFADNWGYSSFETDWRKLVARKDIDLIDIASPNDTHAEIAIAAAEAGKMVMCEKPLGRNAAESEKMVAAVESARTPNMVWYNYRRVPAVTLAKQLVDEGRLGKHLSLSRKIPAGLDDFRRPAAGRPGTLAARCERGRQRRHRRFAGPLHRHRNVAQRTDRHGDGDDRDVHQGAQPHDHRQGRESDDRRRERIPGALSERLARDVRGDPLRARPQGALHARDQRRGRIDHVGFARSASLAIFRSQRRRPCSRLARHCISPMAITPI